MLIWAAFIFLIIIFLALDLGIFNKKDHVISTREASMWTTLWISVALLFSLVVNWLFRENLVDNPMGLTPAGATIKYITGYLIELSLSVDNVFVIAVIFSAFRIPPKFQHRVLFWGILGAIVFRGVMILFGIALINRLEWIIYVFGVFLLYTAYKMLRHHETKFDPKTSFVFIQIKRFIPLTHRVYGRQFIINRMGIKAATPLLVALIVIELTDIMFALDSIPAILAITSDPFLVFSSNILAILGLRSMYFLISRMLDKFRFIHYSLAVILGFVGFKMLGSHYVHIPEWASLTLILSALLGGISLSILIPEEQEI